MFGHAFGMILGWLYAIPDDSTVRDLPVCAVRPWALCKRRDPLGGGELMSNFIKTLFSTTGIFIVVYILIGIFLNTAPPHIPGITATADTLHSWIQYVISIFFWPLSFWHPHFTTGKWTP
jgi:membrane associated rhomboid family serine protease